MGDVACLCGGLVGLCGQRRLLHGLYLMQEGGHWNREDDPTDQRELPPLLTMVTIVRDGYLDQQHLLLASFPGHTHRHPLIASSTKYGGGRWGRYGHMQ